MKLVLIALMVITMTGCAIIRAGVKDTAYKSAVHVKMTLHPTTKYQKWTLGSSLVFPSGGYIYACNNALGMGSQTCDKSYAKNMRYLASYIALGFIAANQHNKNRNGYYAAALSGIVTIRFFDVLSSMEDAKKEEGK